MSLTPGTRLGVYEIIAPLGAGGMGEVYRARDTKLGRSVALKILPDALASDSDRIARFEREAKVLASLTHGNIAALYGMEVATSSDAGPARHYLAMELVEGETLAERLQRGPLKTAAALKIARQIIDALEAAHEQGIVHRDLKPANVKITPEENVKVLDFGLAKAMDGAGGAGRAGGVSEQRANSPTLSMLATQAGIVLGTAAYMSPEQAKGANTDQRSDVFSFGVVLYEMLTCRQPFQGETAPEIMASVMVREPDLSALPPNLHRRLRILISRCLEKQPKQRWQAVGDLRMELEAIASAPEDATGAEARTSARPIWQLALGSAIIVALTALITGGVAWRRLRLPTPSVMRFEVPLAEAQRFAATGRQFVALSPDGKRIAFLIGGNGKVVLMMRTLDEVEARPIAGASLNLNTPFFSPDSQWIAFWSAEDATFKKAAVAGGAAVTVTKAENPLGASWAGDWIVFAQPGRGIMRVAAAGGEAELIARVEPPDMPSSPQLINDGRTLLFAIASGSDSDRWDKATIVVQSVGSDQRQVVMRGGSAPLYVSTGHLLYAVGGILLAVKFDPQTGTVSGGPVPVVEGVMRSTPAFLVGAAQRAVADAGTLVYVPGSAAATGQLTMALIDRDGKAQRLPMSLNSYQTPRVSPDGRQIAVATDDGKEASIWIHTLAGSAPPRRLTFGSRNRHPVWTRDGSSVIFQSDRDGDLGLFRQRADGSGQAERLTKADTGAEHVPGAVAPDGTLVFTVSSPSLTSELWTLSTTRDGTRRVLLAIPGKSLVTPTFSPDGKWLAYGSNELGLSAYNVFVQPFPLTGAKYQVTTAISSTPLWTANGKQMLTAYSDQISVSDLQTTPQFAAGAATRIGSEGSLPSSPSIRNFDLMPDGRLLVVMPVSTTTMERTASRLNVVLNWFEELKAKVK